MAYSSVIFYQRLRYLSSIDFLNFSSYCNVFTNVVYPSATMHRNFRLLFCLFAGESRPENSPIMT
ncbi:hypothetical protein C8Q75DRAFT_300946 [Abortiporus biennis]|nr:hypothetical protein C8Q75DRAFT_300946 [Abortiporus biennis]